LGRGTAGLLSKVTKPVLFARGGLALLESELPRTIADAIALCEQIGERYLWVDALCIQQDDEKDKARQIRNMGCIYRSAVLTIVNASAGQHTNAKTPLLGFLLGTRNVIQRKENIRGHCIILTCRHPYSIAIPSSKWFSRG
jgi:Heterokaryon incompatibility protein (HET)